MPEQGNIAQNYYASTLGPEGYVHRKSGLQKFLHSSLYPGFSFDTQAIDSFFASFCMSRSAARPFVACNLGAGAGQESRDLAKIFKKPRQYDITSISLVDMRSEVDIYYDAELDIRYITTDATDWLSKVVDNHFDLQIMQNFLHCVYDPLTILQLAYQKASPGGLVLFNFFDLDIRFNGFHDFEKLVKLVNQQSAGLLKTQIWATGPNYLSQVAVGYIQVPEGKPDIDFKAGLVGKEIHVKTSLANSHTFRLPIIQYSFE